MGCCPSFPDDDMPMNTNINDSLSHNKNRLSKDIQYSKNNNIIISSTLPKLTKLTKVKPNKKSSNNLDKSPQTYKESPKITKRNHKKSTTGREREKKNNKLNKISTSVKIIPLKPLENMQDSLLNSKNEVETSEKEQAINPNYIGESVNKFIFKEELDKIQGCDIDNLIDKKTTNVNEPSPKINELLNITNKNNKETYLKDIIDDGVSPKLNSSKNEKICFSENKKNNIKLQDRKNRTARTEIKKMEHERGNHFCQSSFSRNLKVKQTLRSLREMSCEEVVVNRRTSFINKYNICNNISSSNTTNLNSNNNLNNIIIVKSKDDSSDSLNKILNNELTLNNRQNNNNNNKVQSINLNLNANNPSELSHIKIYASTHETITKIYMNNDYENIYIINIKGEWGLKKKNKHKKLSYVLEPSEIIMTNYYGHNILKLNNNNLCCLLYRIGYDSEYNTIELNNDIDIDDNFVIRNPKNLKGPLFFKMNIDDNYLEVNNYTLTGFLTIEVDDAYLKDYIPIFNELNFNIDSSIIKLFNNNIYILSQSENEIILFINLLRTNFCKFINLFFINCSSYNNYEEIIHKCEDYINSSVFKAICPEIELKEIAKKKFDYNKKFVENSNKNFAVCQDVNQSYDDVAMIFIRCKYGHNINEVMFNLIDYVFSEYDGYNNFGKFVINMMYNEIGICSKVVEGEEYFHIVFGINK